MAPEGLSHSDLGRFLGLLGHTASHHGRWWVGGRQRPEWELPPLTGSPGESGGSTGGGKTNVTLSLLCRTGVLKYTWSPAEAPM